VLQPPKVSFQTKVYHPNGDPHLSSHLPGTQQNVRSGIKGDCVKVLVGTLRLSCVTRPLRYQQQDRSELEASLEVFGLKTPWFCC